MWLFFEFVLKERKEYKNKQRVKGIAIRGEFSAPGRQKKIFRL